MGETHRASLGSASPPLVEMDEGEARVHTAGCLLSDLHTWNEAAFQTSLLPKPQIWHHQDRGSLLSRQVP